MYGVRSDQLWRLEQLQPSGLRNSESNLLSDWHVYHAELCHEAWIRCNFPHVLQLCVLLHVFVNEGSHFEYRLSLFDVVSVLPRHASEWQRDSIRYLNNSAVK